MKTTICDFCLKTGLLCAKCRERLSKGELSEFYIEVAKKLIKLEKKIKALSTATLYDAINLNGKVILIVGKGDARKFIGIHGAIADKICKVLNCKRLLIIEKDSDLVRVLEQLISPSNIIRISQIWLPDGSIEKKVVVSPATEKRTKLSLDEIKEIVRKVTGEHIRIEVLKS